MHPDNDPKKKPMKQKGSEKHMNVCKKILALLLAMMLLLSMAPAAMAETGSGATTGGTITIEGSGTITYDVYLMYEIEAVATGTSGTETKYKYKIASGWENFEPSAYLSKDGDYVFWQKQTASPSDAAAIAQLAREYLSANTVTQKGKVSKDKSLLVDTNGYYLLVPNNETASGVVIVENGEEKKVQEKASQPGLPVVTKQVKEDTGDTFKNINTVDYGQVFDVKVQIKTAVGASNYILHDEADEHLRICTADGAEWNAGVNDANVFSVKRDGNPLTNGVHYTIGKPDPANGDGCTFHIKFNVENFETPLTDSGTLLVEYKAKLLANDGTQQDHVNSAWMTYTDANVPTDKSNTITQTFKVTVYKIDQDDKPLEGAKFKLTDIGGRYYKLSDDGVVSWVGLEDNPTEVEAVLKTLADGTQVAVAEFVGLDAELFNVVESVVPGGYIGVEKSPVSTRADGKNSQDNTDNFTPGEGMNAEVIVRNSLGNVLPETGGMGTTVFYGFGALLVAAAVVLLVLKKRAV